MKTRSLMNLAMLTALNRAPEIKLHVKGALNNGVTVEEIKAALLHATAYCGIPVSSVASPHAQPQAHAVVARWKRHHELVGPRHRGVDIVRAQHLAADRHSFFKQRVVVSHL
jgi:Carboxymuconolactone decarboxylase family